MLESQSPFSSFIREGEGFDPIIGENTGLPRNTSFLNPDNTSANLTIPQGEFTLSLLPLALLSYYIEYRLRRLSRRRVLLRAFSFGDLDYHCCLSCLPNLRAPFFGLWSYLIGWPRLFKRYVVAAGVYSTICFDDNGNKIVITNFGEMARFELGDVSTSGSRGPPSLPALLTDQLVSHSLFTIAKLHKLIRSASTGTIVGQSTERSKSEFLSMQKL
jgi:hypothetical protein